MHRVLHLLESAVMVAVAANQNRKAPGLSVIHEITEKKNAGNILFS
jgi:hypothetical protein